jgi:NACalpha-BTF3-like transcription factor
MSINNKMPELNKRQKMIKDNCEDMTPKNVIYHEGDIQFVVNNTGVTRIVAIETLNRNQGDIIHSVLDLTMYCYK